MKTPTTLFRSMLLICFLGLMTACGGGEKSATSESAEHGHSHEYHLGKQHGRDCGLVCLYISIHVPRALNERSLFLHIYFRVTDSVGSRS